MHEKPKPSHNKYIREAVKAAHIGHKIYKHIKRSSRNKSERGQGDIQLAGTVNATKLEWVRGKKRGNNTFNKKVEQAIAHAVAPKQIVAKSSFYVASSAGSQAYEFISLLGGASNLTNCYTHDLGQLFKGVDNSAVNNIMYVDHAIMDLCIWYNASSTAPIAVVDIYEVSTKRDTNTTAKTSMDSDSVDSAATAGATLTSPFINTTIGYSPFNSPTTCKLYTINSKRTCLLSSSVSMETIRLSDHKTRKFSRDHVSALTSIGKVTKGYIIIVHGTAPSTTNTALAQFPAVSITVQLIKNFNVRVLKDSQMQTGQTISSI